MITLSDNNTTGVYITWAGGDVYFDVTLSETHTTNALVTEHPVEKGANVTDFVRKNLDKIAFEVFVSNSPINERLYTGGSFTTKKLEVATYTRPFIPTPGAILSAGVDALKSLFSEAQPSNASVLIFDSPEDNVLKTKQKLTDILENATLVSVVTPHWFYQNMLLDEFTMPRSPETGTGAKFSLSFRQLRVVESLKVSSPEPVEKRGTPPASKGQKGPVKAPEKVATKSLAAAAVDNF